MIPLFKVLMSPDAATEVAKTLASGYIGQGPMVDKFEQKLAEVFGVSPDRLLALNSCTSAIDLALHLCGVGPGDEVVVTPMTCAATITPIINRHAVPVWADIDPDTGNIDVADVRAKVTTKTKAIVAVNWGGLVCNYTDLKNIGPPVIEDAAHCYGITSHGDYTCWSFQAIKFLTTGDGGALSVPAHQAERARLLRWYGLDRRAGESFRCSQRIQEAGFKYHMNDVAATIGLANMAEAEAAADKHYANAAYYDKHVDGRKPPLDSVCDYWIYTMLPKNRVAFIAALSEKGITASPVHARCDHHPAFARAAGREYRLPGVDYFAAHNTAIPVGWWLSEVDRTAVTHAVNEAIGD